jgi:hypothetical protein
VFFTLHFLPGIGKDDEDEDISAAVVVVLLLPAIPSGHNNI